jgi:hypothetical protein
MRLRATIALVSLVYSACVDPKHVWVNLRRVTSHPAPRISVFTTPDPTTTTGAGPAATSVIQAPFGAQMVFGAAAKSISGVKQLHLTSPSGENVDVQGTPNADGDVPGTLAILGTDGAGHAGGGSIGYRMGCEPATLVATATNYQGDQSQLTITYQVNAPQQTAKIWTSKLTITPGESFTLTWKSTNATSVDVDGVGPNVSLSGSKTISNLTQFHSFGITAHAPCRADVMDHADVTVVQTTGINGSFLFGENTGEHPKDVTLKVTGVLQPATGSVPTFQATGMGKADPGRIREPVLFQVDGLTPGTWRITATPSDFSLPVVCVVNLTAGGHLMSIDPVRPVGQQCVIN